MKPLALGITVFLTLVVPFVARAEVTDRIVAIVNDDIVTLREVEKYVAVEKKTKYSSMNEYLMNMALREKLDTFIDGLLISQQARKFKIEVGDKEVESAVEGIKKQNLITESELKEQLKKEGIEYKDFVEGIKSSMTRNKVLARVVAQEYAVDDKSLKDYYTDHLGEFTEEEYKLQHIFVSRQKKDAGERAREALDMLDKGRSFGDVAKDFSDEPSKDQGGDIGFARKEDLMPELRGAVRLLIPGSYTRVVQTPYGFHILKLSEVKKGEVIPFDTVKDKIKDVLFQNLSEKRYKEYVAKLKSTAYIEVKI